MPGPDSNLTLENGAGNPWQGRFIGEAIDTAAARWPDRPAVVDGDTTMTFTELTARRDALSAVLAERGIVQGTHVALHMRRCWEHVVLLHALWRSGAVVITLNTAWEADELDYALRFTDTEFLFTSAAVAGKPVAHRLTSLGLPEHGAVAEPRYPALRAVILEDRGAADSDWHVQGWLDTDLGVPPEPAAVQDSVIVFTSGSTSRPKGVIVRQESLLGSAHYFMGRLGLTADDRFLGLGQYFHAGGLVQLLGPALYGAAHHLYDGFRPTEMARAAHEQAITATTGFDLVLSRLLDEFAEHDWPCAFRKVGAAPGTAVHDRLEDAGATVVMMYAMSEAANMVTLTEPALGSERGRMSNGYPLPGVTVRICGPVTRAPQPPDAAGEICFKGWNLFSGYFKAPDLTQEAIDAEGFFHTGDYGWLDDAGRLYYRGRYSMMIKTGGENVSETEVESFLIREVEGVASAAVVGVPDERWGEAVVAYVELAPGVKFDSDALREACRGRLAGYKIPKRFLQVAPGEWPTTPMGKLRKQDLRAAARQSEPDRPITPVKPGFDVVR
ncbi:class I adenylate-forming enzyme family protein [Streptomyces sp. NPDC096310]|uniref:class I adenylate-forming enzyme family protein n=1 Tax=Streptomyces sp. NPDC096310 TaxID=3366082 RepID=UPI0038104916